MRRLRDLAALTLCVTVTGVMVGCEATAPTEQPTIEDLIAWATEEGNAAIQTAGTNSDWYMLVNKDYSWTEDPRTVLLRSRLMPCATAEGEEGQNLEVSLVSDIFADDSYLEAVTRVRNSWEDQGWEISQIGPNYYRADREDGSELSIEGMGRDSGNYMLMSMGSACSSHYSVTPHTALKDLR